MSTRTYHLTLVTAADEPALTRTVGQDELVDVVEELRSGALPAGAELFVAELPGAAAPAQARAAVAELPRARGRRVEAALAA